MSDGEIETRASELRNVVQASIEESLQRSLESNREVIKSLLRSYVGSLETSSGAPEEESEDWDEIDSLSQLRAVVGGRFENLKKRWVAAGFPLKSHRGEKTGDYSVDLEGWTELSTWIHKQGYDSRLAEEAEPAIFYVRKL